MCRRLTCLLFLGVVVGCSSPPENERQQAEGALNAARQADAAVYAPDELRAAETALKQYDAAVAQRDYRQALSDALEARDQAYAAVKQAANRKAETRSQAERLVAELETLTNAAAARLAGASAARPTGAAAEHLRGLVQNANSLLQEARSQLEAQDYQGVVQKLTPAVTDFRRELPAAEPAPVRRKRLAPASHLSQ